MYSGIMLEKLACFLRFTLKSPRVERFIPKWNIINSSGTQGRIGRGDVKTVRVGGREESCECLSSGHDLAPALTSSQQLWSRAPTMFINIPPWIGEGLTKASSLQPLSINLQVNSCYGVGPLFFFQGVATGKFPKVQEINPAILMQVALMTSTHTSTARKEGSWGGREGSVGMGGRKGEYIAYMYRIVKE